MNIKTDIETYRKIVSSIRAAGGVIANAWVETALMTSEKNTPHTKNYEILASDNISAIENADVIIVEATGSSSIGVGYELGLALSKSKPTLILIDKFKRDNSYAVGIKHNSATIKYYDQKDITKSVFTFLKDKKFSTKDLRFNFAIDGRLYNYLRRKAFLTGRTKADIVRDIVLKDMHTRERDS